MDAASAEQVAGELYTAVKDTLVQRVINRLASSVPNASFEYSLGEAA